MQIKRRDLPHLSPSLSVEHPVLQRVYAARGVRDNEALDTSLQSLLPFDALLGIDKAVKCLEQALEAQSRILIVGDFDADGATSSALAVSALRLMGASQVECLVPNRFEYGYGLTPEIIEVARKWHPHLIITVDNGIASFEGVARAKEVGIEVLITDHHLPAETLPEASAIVNPNQPNDAFLSKSIAGVGVIFYVMLALRRHLSQQGWFEKKGLPEPNMAQFLDLVALGTVADVVILDQNNRILVQKGLERIRQGLCRPGIQALIEIAKRRMDTLCESDLGFAIAPRLNAAGRLDDMSLGIDCLLAEHLDKARQLAEALDTLNTERRKIESDMKAQAVSLLERYTALYSESTDGVPPALCLFEEGWHQGVIGILAGRLKERYHRPVIAFAKVSEQEMKGSARSVSGLNIRDLLAAVDKDHPGLILKFGGHAMAAGLSLKSPDFEVFKEALLSEMSKYQHVLTGREIWTDGALEAGDMTLAFARLLKNSGPWGQGFPEPVFDNVFEVLEQRLVGECHLKLTLRHQEDDLQVDAIAFQVDLKRWPNHRARFIHAAFKLDVNEYHGRVRLQLMIVAMNVLE